MSGIPAGAGQLLNKRVGKYDILALLALGGTAEIYLARIGGESGFEKYVVVKCLHDHLADDQDFVKMFLDEARISATLDHSNVVQTLELGEYQNRYYMVMEFLAGLSLAMVVRRAAERIPGGMIPVPLVLNMAAQACAGLHYAHERTQGGKPLNLVHRDISPQNLVVSFEGVVKVVDFGIARAEYRETKTKAGTIKGKFAYMSPEQCVANAVDRRTDVFALGVIVHELLTGRRLFKRNSPYETYQAVLECNVEAPSKLNNQLDPALDAIVMKAVAKDKEKRYATAEAFGDAMLGYLHHRGKGSGGGELGRFFDQHFSQEIEEHGERMRELIQAGNFSVDTGVGWGEEDEKAAGETRDLTGKKGEEEELSLQSGEIIPMRPSEASLDELVGDIDASDAVEEEEDEDEDEDRGQPTQITMNPSALLEQLNEQVARNSGQIPVTPARGAPAVTPARGGPAATPAKGATVATPPRGAPAASRAASAGPAPLPAPPTGPVKPIAKPSSGKFPDLPNLPTVVAPDADEGETRQAPPLRSGPLSSIGPIAQPDPAQAPTAIGAPIVNPAAMKKTEPAMGAQAAPSDGNPFGHPSQNATAPAPALGAYNATAPAPIMHSPPPPPGPMSGYPVMPGGQRPFSSDLAPSNLGSPQRSPYADQPFDPSSAASLMSPVGEQYPHMDWDRAAATPARALAPWQLAVLFAAVVGGAIVLTIVIAKIFV